LIVGEFRDPKVESGIIDKDEGIGILLEKVRLAFPEETQDLPKVHQHLQKSHERRFPVMMDQGPTGFSHPFAAPTAEVSLRIPLFDSFHEIRPMEVSARFSGDEIVIQGSGTI
jgi:hypothetical protein